MKTTLTTLLTLFLAGTALAATLPDGFVYRAKCVPAKPSVKLTKIDVTMRLYEQESSVTPCWTGIFKDVPVTTNNLFQIWVSEAHHDKTVVGEDTLEQALWKGAANWIGISFFSCRETKPRRMMVTTPLANTAVAAETIDPVATVHDLVDCEALTANETCLGRLVCDTLEFGDVQDIKFNIMELKAHSVQLARDSDNAVLARTQSDWRSGVLEPGSAVTNTCGKAAFMTLKSADSLVAPLLTVPVPAGEAFVWQSAPAMCIWRFIPIGAE